MLGRVQGKSFNKRVKAEKSLRVHHVFFRSHGSFSGINDSTAKPLRAEINFKDLNCVLKLKTLDRYHLLQDFSDLEKFNIISLRRGIEKYLHSLDGKQPKKCVVSSTDINARMLINVWSLYAENPDQIGDYTLINNAFNLFLDDLIKIDFASKNLHINRIGADVVPADVINSFNRISSLDFENIFPLTGLEEEIKRGDVDEKSKRKCEAKLQNRRGIVKASESLNEFLVKHKKLFDEIQQEIVAESNVESQKNAPGFTPSTCCE